VTDLVQNQWGFGELYDPVAHGTEILNGTALLEVTSESLSGLGIQDEFHR
jgi:hypothetical protein